MTQSRVKMLGDPEYSEYALSILTREADWEFYQADNQGQVEIMYDINGDHDSIFLSQDELKEVIAFLQKQVKQ